VVQKPPARRRRHNTKKCGFGAVGKIFVLKKIEPALLSGVHTPFTKEPVHGFAGE
jgi:hypothetical protein